MSGSVYFTAADGITYRVLDSTMRAGKLIVADPPAPWATSRVFRPATGYRRLFRIEAPADREIDSTTLARQLARAEFLPAGPPHVSVRDPR
jgi:hypothetical protein